jgi:putative endonuclease
MSEPSLARKPWWPRWFGNRSERAAARFLKRLGYRILVRNSSCQLGELDLIALDNSCIVFAEVRSTGGEDALRPALSVDYNKQKRLTKLALYFLQSKKLLGHAARFDVLAISWPANRAEPEIVHYQNAFEAVGKWQMFS